MFSHAGSGKSRLWILSFILLLNGGDKESSVLAEESGSVSKDGVSFCFSVVRGCLVGSI